MDQHSGGKWLIRDTKQYLHQKMWCWVREASFLESMPIAMSADQAGFPSSITGITLGPRQNGRRFADDTFKRIFLNENLRISIKISPKSVPKGPINKNPALVQIMAWRRSGDKPLSEPMMVSLLTHICVTRLQWVKTLANNYLSSLGQAGGVIICN